MTHTLLTDEAVHQAVRASLRGVNIAPVPIEIAVEDPRNVEAVNRALVAFIAHHEGEQPCERCGGTGYRYRGADCPDCGGTGKVREDRLVKLSEVVAALRSNPFYVATQREDDPESAADFIERMAKGKGDR